MNSLNFDSSPETNESQSTTTPLKIPRLDSLQHRLQQAKDADGQPIPLLDELLFFLDDPPPEAVSNNKNTLSESTKKSAPGTSTPLDGILSKCPHPATSYHPITEYHHPLPARMEFYRNVLAVLPQTTSYHPVTEYLHAPPPSVVSMAHFRFDHREGASSHSGGPATTGVPVLSGCASAASRAHRKLLLTSVARSATAITGTDGGRRPPQPLPTAGPTATLNTPLLAAGFFIRQRHGSKQSRAEMLARTA
jgi:hypothetical protein